MPVKGLKNIQYRDNFFDGKINKIRNFERVKTQPNIRNKNSVCYRVTDGMATARRYEKKENFMCDEPKNRNISENQKDKIFYGNHQR